MRKLFSYYVWLMLMLLSASCKKSEDVKLADKKPEVELIERGRVYPNPRFKIIHLSSDTVYILNESFSRQAGEQLIVDAGTIIKVTGTVQPTITINPGAIITCNGTSERPIVFTSNSAPGAQTIGWGGIILKGKSTDNSIGTSGDPADNSGVLNYVRIEFGKLQLSGVGNLTSVSNVQVSYSGGNPSFEIDGGTFNARNLVSFASGGGADFYITRGYTGRLQNIVGYRHPYFGLSNNPPYNTVSGIFVENNADNPTAKPETNTRISNASMIGPDNQNGSTQAYSDTNGRAAALVTTGNASFQIRNSAFLGYPLTAWYLDDQATAIKIQNNSSGVTYSLFQSGDPTRSFYLKPGSYDPYTSDVFRDFILDPSKNNSFLSLTSDFLIRDLYNYDKPDLLPLSNSPLLQGANFSGGFSDPFFNVVDYKGAFGTENWMSGWTNFTPLKTTYNYPK